MNRLIDGWFSRETVCMYVCVHVCVCMLIDEVQWALLCDNATLFLIKLRTAFSQT